MTRSAEIMGGGTGFIVISAPRWALAAVMQAPGAALQGLNVARHIMHSDFLFDVLFFSTGFTSTIFLSVATGSRALDFPPCGRGSAKLGLKSHGRHSLSSGHMKIVIRGETMRTEQRTKKIRVQVIGAAREAIDPEALWLDQDIAPEELITRDPLDITPEMMDEAEQPELGDFSLVHLPARGFNLRTEALEMKLHRRQTVDSREPVEAFIARLWGKGST